MAFLGLKVPHETVRLLGQIKVEGEKVDLSEMHITLMYLGKGLPIEAITAATEVAFAVTSKTRPFTVRTELVTSFPRNPDAGIPIIARIESDALGPHGCLRCGRSLLRQEVPRVQTARDLGVQEG